MMYLILTAIAILIAFAISFILLWRESHRRDPPRRLDFILAFIIAAATVFLTYETASSILQGKTDAFDLLITYSVVYFILTAVGVVTVVHKKESPLD